MRECTVPLERNWDFRPSRPSVPVKLQRLRLKMNGWTDFPAWSAVRPLVRSEKWNTLFLFLPDGRLSAWQRDNVARVARMSGSTAIIAATPTYADLPLEELQAADALYWKNLTGFDFSAYALAMAEVARHSPGADMYLQNDSVLGPFGPIDDLIGGMPWRFGGFLSSSAIENHIQSFAFVVRGVDSALVEQLSPVFSTDRALDRWEAVVSLQETRMARTAARSMHVGSSWFAPEAHTGQPGLARALAIKSGLVPSRMPVGDPSLCAAGALLGQGFPFLKKSLFGKNAHLHERSALAAFLDREGLAPADHA